MISTTLPRSEIAGLPVVDAGAGYPVVLLHGVGLCADTWHAQIDILRRRYRVIAPDMPGHGQSPVPTGPVKLDDYVQAYLPLLESLDEAAIVIGHSMGATIAVELALQVPSKVCAIAALNAVFERTPDAAAAVQARALSLDGTGVPDPTPTLVRWFGDHASPERTICENLLRAVDPKGYKLAYTTFALSDGPSRATLRLLTCPALFATGALEPNSTPAMSRAMAALTPQGRYLIIEGAAHMMPMTHAEAVNGAIMDLAQAVWP